MYKTIWIGWKQYKIRKLKPGHFIDVDGGLPISIFKLKKDKTLQDIMDEKIPNDTNKSEIDVKELEENIKLIKLICSKAIKDFNFEKFFNIKNINHCVKVYNFILKNSFEFYEELTDVKETQLEYYDLLAKRYGKEPFDYLLGNLDRFMFNSITASYSIEKENHRIKVANMKNKARSKRR